MIKKEVNFNSCISCLFYSSWLMPLALKNSSLWLSTEGPAIHQNVRVDKLPITVPKLS